jgi:hypothetical protein
VEQALCGCTVRMFFSLQPNEQIVKNILDNLMNTFDSRMKSSDDS